MAVARTARTAVERIRKLVAAGTQQWSETEILATLDEALESIWTETNSGTRDHNLDTYDALTTDLESATPDLVRVTGISGCYEFEPPEWMGPIRAIEQIISLSPDQTVPVPTTASLIRARSFFSSRPYDLGWYRVAQDKLRIHGLTQSTKIRIWFLRRWPAMHYGSILAPGTTTQATLAATAGRLVSRANLYTGSRIEWSTGNPDQIVRITGSAAPLTPLTVNFTPALPAAVAVGHQYSLVLPCDPEHAKYAIWSTALDLISGRDANSPQSAELRAEVSKLRDAFNDDLSSRDLAQPHRPYNSRVLR